MMKLLLTGRPGIGKSTVIQKVLAACPVTPGGFVTSEIRRGGARVGFLLKTTDGKEEILVHIHLSSPYRVGKYGVDVPGFESIALPALQRDWDSGALIVVDEIGTMELCSSTFRDMVVGILRDEYADVVGVVRMGNDPFIGEIRLIEGLELVAVTTSNRERLVSDILRRIRAERITRARP